MKPYKTEPILKERLWGGQKLKAYNKYFNNERMGESWETYSDSRDIPILIKFIDADDILSVQVHPDDRYAAAVEKEPNGKTEAWFVLDAEDDACIIHGFNQETDRRKLEKELEDNKLTDLLNRINVKKGDCIYIPAGTIHALGKGLTVYEIQQPSDLTYRLYDWDRRDGDGRKRALHIEKALEVIEYQNPFQPIKNVYQEIQNKEPKDIICVNIADCRYFKADYIRLAPQSAHNLTPNTFHAVSILSGHAYIHFEGAKMHMQKGDTWVVPEAYRENVSIKTDETTEMIETIHVNVK